MYFVIEFKASELGQKDTSRLPPSLISRGDKIRIETLNIFFRKIMLLFFKFSSKIASRDSKLTFLR